MRGAKTKPISCLDKNSEVHFLENNGGGSWSKLKTLRVEASFLLFFFHLFANHTTPGVWLYPGSLVRRRRGVAGEAAAAVAAPLPGASWRQIEKERL